MTQHHPVLADGFAPLAQRVKAPLVVGGFLFVWLFWQPFGKLLTDWWTNPEAGHGLLLGPIALWLMYRQGLDENARPRPWAGLLILGAAVLLRIVSGLAAELFTMRMSMIGAGLGVVVYGWGFGQVRRWWLGIALLILSVPIPSVVLSTLALPLQLKASQMGAALLTWRDVPVLVSGNVINLPGQSLFVTEACSGLRSLTALISLGLLMGGLWLHHPATRGFLLFVTVPVAMLVNGVRVFLTGFLVYFVDPAFGQGFMHLTEGWVLFVVAFGILSAVTWGLGRAEGVVRTGWAAA